MVGLILRRGGSRVNIRPEVIIGFIMCALSVAISGAVVVAAISWLVSHHD
jgi:hypothetical protein